MRNNLARRILVLVAVGFLAGCQAPRGTTQPEPAVAEVPRPHALAEVVTPLEAYFGTAQQRHTLARAEDVLIRACMRGLGLDWPVEDPRQVRVTLQAWDLGFLDADTVPRYGYHPPGLQADLDVSVGGPANGARVLTGVQKAAYTGIAHPSLAGKPVPRDGCAAEAQRRLNQDAPEADGAVAIMIANLTGERALTDGRVVAVTKQWSDCMSARGYRYANPYDSRDDPRWNGEDTDQAEPAARGLVEIQTAQADLACRQQVNYLGVRLAVLAAYQDREIQAQPDLFTPMRQRHEQCMRNAEFVLST